MAVSSDLTSNGMGAYMMKIGIGTPPVEVLGYADTGSSLIWTQGNLATETLTIGSHTLLSTVVGVGHENTIATLGGSGIIGLDYGDASLISRLGPVINGVFSFCLSPPFDMSRPSRIKFGSDGVVSGPSAVSTPITRKSSSNAYFLTLEAISVGETRLEFLGSAYGGANEGNMMIDSGTTLTFLPIDFYNQVVAVVEKVVNAEKVTVGKAGFNLCYKAPGNDVILPEIQMHFKGADLKLSPSSSFPRLSPEVVCLSFFGSADNVSIYGNAGQADLLVGYDRNAGTVSFMQQQCN
ncbi:PREDICTED: aspartic proteinase CDR1-like [Tarenaya hassleriana]|uniref:aspartic proteinase CDR1-like n=1 Tax=Tarenaya hassleriana TaxID=28532 RepID=UPI00053C2A29|nr:PREDICTED: aspartic proteinase CDR1-like [Tarenaya hassleriana]